MKWIQGNVTPSEARLQKTVVDFTLALKRFVHPMAEVMPKILEFSLT